MNFALDDGSVKRYDKVLRHEANPSDPNARMAQFTQDADHRNPSIFVYTPRR